MAQSVYPPIFLKKNVVTLTSGTSWTVPAGVTKINATLIGGGGGSGGANITTFGGASSGGTGGTTTFTGATSATGGAGGAGFNGGSGNNSSANSEFVSYSPTANTGLGAFGARQSVLYNSQMWAGEGHNGSDSQKITSTLTTTPGASISYAIGAGGTAGASGTNGVAGAAGASGSIIIEYWV